MWSDCITAAVAVSRLFGIRLVELILLSEKMSNRWLLLLLLVVVMPAVVMCRQVIACLQLVPRLMLVNVGSVCQRLCDRLVLGAWYWVSFYGNHENKPEITDMSTNTSCTFVLRSMSNCLVSTLRPFAFTSCFLLSCWVPFLPPPWIKRKYHISQQRLLVFSWCDAGHTSQLLVLQSLITRQTGSSPPLFHHTWSSITTKFIVNKSFV